MEKDYKEKLREEFDKTFPDPMTKKYGQGFALYCSNCSFEGRNKRTDWWLAKIDEVLDEIIPEGIEEGVYCDKGTDITELPAEMIKEMNGIRKGYEACLKEIRANREKLK